MAKFLWILGFGICFSPILFGEAKFDPSEKTINGFYKVSANWSELKRGGNLLVLSVTTPDDKAVTNASIKITYSWVEKPLPTPDSPVKERENGIYEKPVFLEVEGKWKFDIKIQKDSIEDSLVHIKDTELNTTEKGLYQIQGNWGKLKRGWHTLILHVMDPKGADVAGAKVTIDYDMIDHSMNPPVKPVEEKPGGIYEKRIFLGMKGLWKFEMNVSKDSNDDKVIRQQEIPD